MASSHESSRQAIQVPPAPLGGTASIRPSVPRSMLLLGAGELGKEIAISGQRLGLRVIAADRYRDAPAMQVAHVSEVLSLLDAKALEGVIRTHQPDLIVPEVEAISAKTLAALETEGFRVVPSAAAAACVTDRGALRRVVHEELGIATPKYGFAASQEELLEACDQIGYPCVVKPVIAYAGRGLSVVPGPSRVERAWAFAYEGSEESTVRVMVEEFVEFRTEVTLLTVREWDGRTTFLPPIGQRQERGDYRESWLPAEIAEERLAEMQEIAARVTARLGGSGVFGIEFFETDSGVVFSELSIGPHDTGMVTMISHDLSQFDLHVRAMMGLPIPAVRFLGPSATAVILSSREGEVTGYRGLERALQVESSQIRIFGKPLGHVYRRMGVALASGATVAEARARALEAGSRVAVEYA